MRISRRSIEEVREAADIGEVASEFTAVRRQGERHTGLCPYPDHQEKTPSFSVSPERGFYYCFGCQRGGDAIKLVSEMRSLSFVEAVVYLAERSGVELEYEGYGGEEQAFREKSQRRRSVHKALAAAAVYYQKYLRESRSPEAEQARSYLQSRSMEPATIEKFRLGYAPTRRGEGFVNLIARRGEGSEDAAGKLGFEREVLEAAGLISPRGGERFAGRITFPISDRRGRIVGFGARALGEDRQPKYLNSPETEVFNKREQLYGLPQAAEAIRRERAALVVEGYTDVLMLHQSGIENAVATLGTATTPAHLKLLSGYAERIYALFDPDAAGEQAMERAATTAAGLKLDLRAVQLPEDPADWISHHQPEELGGLLEKAVPVLEHIFRRKAGRAWGASTAERSRVMSEIKELVREIEDPVFYRDAIRLASEALGVSPSEVEAPRPPKHGSTPAPTTDRDPEDPLREAGREVLALILTQPDLTAKLLAEGVREAPLSEPVKLSPEDFGEEDQSQIFSILSEHAGETLDEASFDERLRPFMDSIGSLSAKGERLYPSEASVRQSWLRLAILSRQRAKQQSPDYDEKYRLHSEIQLLNQALRAVPAQT